MGDFEKVLRGEIPGKIQMMPSPRDVYIQRIQAFTLAVLPAVAKKPGMAQAQIATVAVEIAAAAIEEVDKEVQRKHG